jgi:hypothetical protein
MTRTMGDSTDVNVIPKSVDIVATYVDGHMGVVNEQLMKELFPSDRYFHVLIDVNGSRPDAQVRDWENGDKAGSLEQWVIDHNTHSGKKDAVVYCNESTIAEVRRLTGSQILGKDYFLWVATLDGSIFRGFGVIACQNRGANQNGANFDTSMVFDDTFWQLANAGPPKPICDDLQRAVRTTVDGIWGQETDTCVQSLVKAWSDEFPYGVVFAQHTVGTRGDGFWGPNSKNAMHLTTASVQRALKNSMGFDPGKIDGFWGPKTDAACSAARKACHI